MNDPVDTGFEDVLAGEVYEHADLPSVTVQEAPPANPHVCASATGNRCDICFGPIEAVTATVTTPEPTGLTPAGVQAAKALAQLPKELDWPTLARLAREVAMDIKERHVILADFKLTNVQYEFIEEHNDFFRQALSAACKEWHAPLSTQDRIKVEAAAILEDSLPGLGARMQNKGEGLPGVIEAAKLFAKVAGVGERDASGAAPGERFSINIDLGGDTKITVQATTVAHPPSADAVSVSLPAAREGG